MRVRVCAGWGLWAIVAVAWSAFLGELSAGAETPDAEWKAGVASVVITPEGPMWMAGYAARDKPSEGKIHDLYAKALALEDPHGSRLVIVTLDLVGVRRRLRDSLVAEVAKPCKLPPEGLLLNASHTHCGPELRPSKAALYDLAPERVKQAEQYCDALQGKLRGYFSWRELVCAATSRISNQPPSAISRL